MKDSDIAAVRYALNTTDNEQSWDAFNRILTEIERLRKENEQLKVSIKQKDTQLHKLAIN